MRSGLNLHLENYSSHWLTKFVLYLHTGMVVYFLNVVYMN